MARQTLVVQSSAQVADSTAAANTIPLRDSQGGVVHAAVTTGLLSNTGAEVLARTAVKTSVYTATTPTNGTGGDRVVLCNPTSAGFVVNLPAAATLAGQALTIKNVSSSTNALTVTPNGAETIDGAATLAMTTAWGYATLLSDGSNWFRIA
jgi:hypothetical protein